MADTTPSKDLIAAITSSRDAYFAYRPHLRRTEAEDRLFAEAFVLGADSVLDHAASPPDAAQADGWISVDERLPPCTNDQDYIGINSAGFAGIFNAIADIAGNVYCMMETAEDSVSIMSDLSIWKPFTRPLPAPPNLNANGEV